jgi:hypothetical protein
MENKGAGQEPVEESKTHRVVASVKNKRTCVFTSYIVINVFLPVLWQLFDLERSLGLCGKYGKRGLYIDEFCIWSNEIW